MPNLRHLLAPRKLFLPPLKLPLLPLVQFLLIEGSGKSEARVPRRAVCLVYGVGVNSSGHLVETTTGSAERSSRAKRAF